MLNNKAEKSEVNIISNSISSLTTRVENIEEFLNSDYFNNRFEAIETDLGIVKDAVTWKDLI